MFFLGTNAAATALAGLVAITLPLSMAVAQEPVPDRTFGDWQISCPKDEPCRMAQTIVLKTSRIPIVRLRVYGGARPTALFTFPLGSLLTTGWRYRVDGGKETLRPFEICNTEGCHAGVKLSSKLIGRMKRGNKLKVTFFDANQQPVTPEMSLAGFTKAFEELK